MSVASRPAVSDVIVAAATPWGYGALGVVRLSGASLDAVLAQICEPDSGWPLPPGRQRRVRLRDAQGVFDDGTVVLGRAPATYTGEDTAEITCHGNPLVVERLIGSAIAAGARLAEPGAFTRRAFEHGKVDLLRAEGVLQVSRARTRRGLEVGRQSLEGGLSAFVADVYAALAGVAAELEARLDYPGDELAYQGDAALVDTLREQARACRALAATHRAGQTLVQGARVALVGTVNAGKSSLFNQLVGSRRALVHERPGTTRDVLEVSTVLDGVAITLLDTAGERATDDPVEAAGLALAAELVEAADLLVVVLRARSEGIDEVERAILARTADRERVLVYNGVDRPGVAPAPPGAVQTVATTGEGCASLGRVLRDALLGEEPGGSRLVIASARQQDLLLTIARHAEQAIDDLAVAGVAVAADAVVQGMEVIDELTGADPREAVLDSLFARFCIGK